MTDAGFPRQSRLLTSGEFSPVFDKPDYRLSSRYLLLLARHSGHDQPRIGLVIGKRHIRKAVQRNRIKRIMRESFRVMKNDFATIDLVFLARAQLDTLSNQDVRKQSDHLLGQLLSQSRKSNRGAPIVETSQTSEGSSQTSA